MSRYNKCYTRNDCQEFWKCDKCGLEVDLSKYYYPENASFYYDDICNDCGDWIRENEPLTNYDEGNYTLCGCKAKIHNLEKDMYIEGKKVCKRCYNDKA